MIVKLFLEEMLEGGGKLLTGKGGIGGMGRTYRFYRANWTNWTNWTNGAEWG